VSRLFLKVAGWVCGLALLAVFGSLAVLMIDWGKSTAKTEKDTLIRDKTSPNGKFVAEIHTFITAMHGGPDRLYVIIKPAQGDHPTWEERLYTRTYECNDTSAFELDWPNSTELIITYGECQASPGHDQDENRVWEQMSVSHGITITYRRSDYVATR